MRSTIIRITALILAAALILTCGASLFAGYPQEQEEMDAEESTDAPIPSLRDVRETAEPPAATHKPAARRTVLQTPETAKTPRGNTAGQDEPVPIPDHAYAMACVIEDAAKAASADIILQKPAAREDNPPADDPSLPVEAPGEEPYSQEYPPKIADGTTDEAVSDGDSADRYASLTLSEEDLELLARLVYLESRGEPYEGQVAVAEVVLNRVLSDRFPDTVEEVIYQAGQFTPASYIESTTPGEEQYEAVADAVDGETCVTGADVVFFSGAPYNDRIYAVIGNHYFCEL